MSTFTAHFPAGLPMLAPLFAVLRKCATAPSSRPLATAAAVPSGIWTLYRMAAASDSVSPDVRAALAARVAD